MYKFLKFFGFRYIQYQWWNENVVARVRTSKKDGSKYVNSPHLGKLVIDDTRGELIAEPERLNAYQHEFQIWFTNA